MWWLSCALLNIVILFCDENYATAHNTIALSQINKKMLFSGYSDGNLSHKRGSTFVNNFTFASLATNLSVDIRIYNKTSKRKLQLFISWIKPTVGRLPDSYNLHVVPANTSKFEHCGNDAYYGFITDNDASNWSVPEYSQLHARGLHDGLTILPECTYDVVLESNPHNGKNSMKTTFTVPDCVEDICSCRLAKNLSEPLLNVKKVTWDTVNVTWSISSQSYLDGNFSFIIGMGEKMASSKSQKGIYNMSWLKEVHASKGKSQYFTLLVLPRRNTRVYMVAIHLLDPRRCLGTSGNFTFEVTDDIDNRPASISRIEMIMLTVLPTVSCILALCVAGILFWRKSFLSHRRLHADFPGRVRHVTHFRPTYRSVSIDGCPTSRVIFPSNQERNILYVEKEIEDAQARGEADKFEISYSRITLGKEIGKGAFGRVFLAQAEAIAGVPGLKTVAVKKLKYKANADELEEFQAEIAMMKKVGRHPNVINMLGCCTLQQPYCMVMEYIPCGDLLQYLRQLRNQVRRPLPSVSSRGNSTASRSSESSSYVEPDTGTITSSIFSSSVKHSKSFVMSDKLEYVLDPRELQMFAMQIAKGMTHLEQKQITHRDLAARNILVDKDKTLKISDFGLSRTGIYVNTKHKKVPLRWLSVEAMRDSLYSSKSDVWAFGIVLWEIGTLGGFPYPTVGDFELLNYLLQGNRLAKPVNCSDELYNLMMLCWSHSADARPTFQQLVTCLDTSASNKRVYVNFDDLQNEIVLPPTEQLQQPIKKVNSPDECKV